MTILQSGAAVPTIPGLYVGITPPQANYITPAETDILGVVGTATWGPVNSPKNVAGLTDFIGKFGYPQARKYDGGTQVWTANLQGAQNFRFVRVTDGTDTAATAALGVQTATSAVVSGGTGYTTASVVTLSNGAVINVSAVTGGAITTFTVATQPTSEVTGAGAVTAVSATGGGTGATFTFTYTAGATVASKYTGSGANGDTVSIAPGRQSGTWAVTVNHPGRPTETFQNIGLGLTGNALWAAIVSAVNNGINGQAASKIVVLTVGTSTTAPASQSATLAGGTDGVTTITATVLLGVDTSPRTGMYALRKQGCSVALLADCDTSSSWTTQVVFGLSEGVYMVMTGPSGDTISNATSVAPAAGINSYAGKLMFGDWVYLNDTINGYNRLTSPQGWVAGYIAANQPQLSSLNQQLQGIVGTQKSTTGVPYYDDDLASLYAAGIDVITNPVPGGAYFGARFGINSSASPQVNGDNYTRMTNFLAASFNASLGPYIGQLELPSTIANAKAALTSFLASLAQAGAIGSPTGATPYSVAVVPNTPPGVLQFQVLVVYANVISQLLVNVQGGQSVTINTVSTTSAIS
jgi:hypothetical protein